jgi:hypothetical protein
MIRPDTTPTTTARARVAAPRLIDLAIHGSDLVIAGRFEHWVPVSLETGGAQGEAQVLFDVTSPGPANDAGDLFAFTSSDVRQLADGAYLARGSFRQGETEHSVEAVVQAPAGHSPFAAVTFRVDEAAFPEVWSALADRMAARPAADLEVRPRAWLLAPVLAAA